MDLTTPLLSGAMLAVFTAIFAWLGNGRYRALDRRIDSFEARVDRQFEHVDRRFEQLMAEIAQLRSDLLQVALASAPRRETG